MGAAYDKIHDFIAKFNKETGRTPSIQEVMNHFDMKTESEDPDSILNDSIYELIEIAIQDYIVFKKKGRV